MNITWDAENYRTDFSFVAEYGSDVLALVDFSAARTGIDLGCGSGALTWAMKEKGLEVTGIDQSPEQLAVARRTYPSLRFVAGDAVSFVLPQPVDVVFANAVFHWIDSKDQDRMLSCVAKSLYKGGHFFFEMGGMGNNALIHGALEHIFAERGHRYVFPFYFPSIAEYACRLEKAGFEVRLAHLFDRPTRLKGENGLEDWLRMFVRRPFEGMDEAEADGIRHEAACRLKDKLFYDGAWHSDYVRLRVKAIKAGA